MRAVKIVMIFILIALTISAYPLIVNASESQENWTLIYVTSDCRTDSYGHKVCYTVKVYKFSGYTQNGYNEWYTVYLVDTNDPVNPTSNDEGWTVAGKAGQSATGGGVGPYIYDVNGVFSYDKVVPSSSQTSCVTQYTESFSVSASLSKDGPMITASFGIETTWRVNGVSWALTDVYPKTHWEFWHCNEPPPSSAELGAAWTFEVSVTYRKTYPDKPDTVMTYTVEVSPSAGFRHWYQTCFLWKCWWESDYSIHYGIPLQIRFSNQ